MKTLDERVYEIKDKALKYYQRTFREAKEVALREHLLDTLVARLETAHLRAYNWSTIYVYLHKGQNITRDIYTFIEENEEFLTLIGGAEAYKVTESDVDTQVKFSWPNLSLTVDYSDGSCKRVKTGSVQKVVTQNTYKVECI